MRTLIAATTLSLLLFTQAGFADPLHKYGGRGDWRHADSGWIFPTNIGTFTRVGEPYTIDGNNDVGAEYVASDGASAQKRILVSVYFPDSAATGASLSGAKAAFLKGHSHGEGTLAPEQTFEIPQTPDVKGVRLTAPANPASGDSRSILYFFSAPSWIVTVTATIPASDESATDELVRKLRWDTLGVYDDNMHGGGPQ